MGAITVPSNEEALVQAWRGWDEHPGDVQAAFRMETACITLASELGWTATKLRQKLLEGRQEGKTYQKTIRELLQ